MNRTPYAYRSRWLYSHYWTLVPHLLGRIQGRLGDDFVPWRRSFVDPVQGNLNASGYFHPTRPDGDLVVLIHGLGSDPNARYVIAATKVLVAAGVSVLRLSFRGADGQTPDFYNAALTRAIHEAMACATFDGYHRRFILGFSLGGHLSLRFATETDHPAVCGVAAVCPPLDLGGCQVAFDTPRINLYRSHCLAGLRRTVRAAETRARRLGRSLGVPIDSLDDIRTIRAWDETIVAPRFGYDGADHYYELASVGPCLNRLRRPALLVASAYDPMVPVETLEPYLAAPMLTARVTESGGHVGFPRALDLGLGPHPGLIPQIMAWFEILGQPLPADEPASAFNLVGYGPSWQRE